MFSVLISIYKKDQPEFLDVALNSIIMQTLIPKEVVIVIDGEIGYSLRVIVEKYQKSDNIYWKIIELEKNVGLGAALKTGLAHCSFDIVARMDSDDICYLDRFEKQYAYLVSNSNISIVGSFINEFISTPGDLNKLKVVPASNIEIVNYSKFRNPLNHPSVMFRKTAVLAVGNYIDMPLFEDYFLWLRMISDGYQMANIQEPLLHFRFSKQALNRRHGFSYIKKELNFLIKCHQYKLINTFIFLKAICSRLPLRVLPKPLLQLVYNKLLRR